MARAWLSIRVDLVEGHGQHLWSRPGRIFAAARRHTFAQYDIQQAATLLAEFTAGRQFAESMGTPTSMTDWSGTSLRRSCRSSVARSVRCWAPRRREGAGI
jgi:hypothetical protein